MFIVYVLGVFSCCVKSCMVKRSISSVRIIIVITSASCAKEPFVQTSLLFESNRFLNLIAIDCYSLKPLSSKIVPDCFFLTSKFSFIPEKFVARKLNREVSPSLTIDLLLIFISANIYHYFLG